MTHPIQARVERADWWRDHLRQRCGRGNAPRAKRRTIIITQVIVAVCEFYGLDPDQLKTRTREREVVLARQIGFYLARKMTGRSLPEIGRQFGGFDHSTIVHAIRRIDELLISNPEIRTDVDMISGALLNGW